MTYLHSIYENISVATHYSVYENISVATHYSVYEVASIATRHNIYGIIYSYTVLIRSLYSYTGQYIYEITSIAMQCSIGEIMCDGQIMSEGGLKY